PRTTPQSAAPSCWEAALAPRPHRLRATSPAIATFIFLIFKPPIVAMLSAWGGFGGAETLHVKKLLAHVREYAVLLARDLNPVIRVAVPILWGGENLLGQP